MLTISPPEIIHTLCIRFRSTFGISLPIIQLKTSFGLPSNAALMQGSMSVIRKKVLFIDFSLWGHCISIWNRSSVTYILQLEHILWLGVKLLSFWSSTLSLLARQTNRAIASQIPIILGVESLKSHHGRYMDCRFNLFKRSLLVLNMSVVRQNISSNCQAFAHTIFDHVDFDKMCFLPVVISYSILYTPAFAAWLRISKVLLLWNQETS